jgi:hypothetical protein
MSSSAAAAKALEERGIFACFAQAAVLNVRPESITQPDPPDIRCEIERLGPVGFELVQLEVGDELRRMKYLGRGPEFLEDTIRDMPPDVSERHRRAQINVAFDSKANKGQRRGALRLIAAVLCKVEGGTEGAFLEERPEGLESAELRCFPTITDGPRMRDVSDCAVRFEPGRIAPVGIELDRIDKKIARYPNGWSMRTELLAYARWGMPFSDQPQDAQQFLARRLPAGIFARGWIYELTSRRIVACAP